LFLTTFAYLAGLPAWITELRHEATHNELPSLSMLRAAAAFLLGWFLDNYWLPQSMHLTRLSEQLALSCDPVSSPPSTVPAADNYEEGQDVDDCAAMDDDDARSIATTITTTFTEHEAAVIMFDEENSEPGASVLFVSTVETGREESQIAAADPPLPSSDTDFIERTSTVGCVLQPQPEQCLELRASQLRLQQLLQQSSPTIFTDVFIPLFLTAVTSFPTADEHGPTKALISFTDDNRNQLVQTYSLSQQAYWLPLLTRLSTMNRYIVGMCVTRLVALAVGHLNVVSSRKKQQYQYHFDASNGHGELMSANSEYQIVACEKWIEVIVLVFCGIDLGKTDVTNGRSGEDTSTNQRLAVLLDQYLYLRSLVHRASLCQAVVLASIQPRDACIGVVFQFVSKVLQLQRRLEYFLGAQDIDVISNTENNSALQTPTAKQSSKKKRPLGSTAQPKTASSSSSSSSSSNLAARLPSSWSKQHDPLLDHRDNSLDDKTLSIVKKSCFNYFWPLGSSCADAELDTSSTLFNLVEENIESHK
jgi:hypothetical protein